MSCRQAGNLQTLPQGEILTQLDKYCEQAIPLRSLQLEYEQGVRSRLDRSALWLWVYLERLCHAMAEQVSEGVITNTNFGSASC